MISKKTIPAILQNNLSRYVIAIAVLINMACASQRLVEKSHKNRPEWVYGMQRGYVVGFGQETDIVNAQNAAMMDVRAKITEAVFNEIHSQKRLKVSETQSSMTFNVVSDFVKETISSTHAGAFTQGVSLSNTGDYYYEVVKNRKTGQTNVLYAIKYPFSRFELQSYIAEWNKMQERLITEKDLIEKNLDNHNSLDKIFSDIEKLTRIRQYLVADQLIQTDLLLSALLNTLRNMQIKLIYEKDYEIHFMLKSKDRTIDFNTSPVITSEYFFAESLYKKGEYWVLKYSEKNKENIFTKIPEIRIRISHRTYSWDYDHKITPKVSLTLESPVIFEAVRFAQNNNEVVQFECVLKTSSAGIGNIVLEQILINPLKVNNNKKTKLTPISIEFAANTGLKPGSASNRYRITTSINRSMYSTSNGEIILSGTIFYREAITGKRSTHHFNNIKLKTNW